MLPRKKKAKRGTCKPKAESPVNADKQKWVICERRTTQKRSKGIVRVGSCPRKHERQVRRSPRTRHRGVEQDRG